MRLRRLGSVAGDAWGNAEPMPPSSPFKQHQNVSDVLSSMAFLSLAAAFPSPRYKRGLARRAAATQGGRLALTGAGGSGSGVVQTAPGTSQGGGCSCGGCRCGAPGASAGAAGFDTARGAAACAEGAGGEAAANNGAGDVEAGGTADTVTGAIAAGCCGACTCTCGGCCGAKRRMEAEEEEENDMIGIGEDIVGVTFIMLCHTCLRGASSLHRLHSMHNPCFCCSWHGRGGVRTQQKTRKPDLMSTWCGACAGGLGRRAHLPP